MEFWKDWLEMWSEVSAKWNALDAKIQSGEVVLTASQKAAYDVYSEVLRELDRAIGDVDAEDLAELKLIASGDEIAGAVLDGVGKALTAAGDFIDSIF